MQRIANLTETERARFDAHPLAYMLDALRETPERGEIYSGDGCAAARFGNDVFFAGKAPEDAEDFLRETLLGEGAFEECGILLCMAAPEDWRRAVERVFPEVKVFPRSVYAIDPRAAALPEDHENIRAITREVMAYPNAEMIAEEVTITLGGVDRFFERGFGRALIEGGAVAGFCTAEYLSETACAIGIAIQEEFRRKGNAKAMTRAFLSDAREKYARVYWECWTNNEPSVKTALACGFEKRADYGALFLEKGFNA